MRMVLACLVAACLLWNTSCGLELGLFGDAQRTTWATTLWREQVELIAAFFLVLGQYVMMRFTVDDQCLTWVTTFFQKPDKEQEAEFRQYALEQQYALFLCGNQVMHPPAMYLMVPFAMGGKRVVGFLQSKLAQATEDLTIRDIVLVLEEVQRQKTYDVAGDRDLMQLITDSVARIKDDDRRHFIEQMVRDIKEGRR